MHKAEMSTYGRQRGSGCRQTCGCCANNCTPGKRSHPLAPRQHSLARPLAASRASGAARVSTAKPASLSLCPGKKPEQRRCPLASLSPGAGQHLTRCQGSVPEHCPEHMPCAKLYRLLTSSGKHRDKTCRSGQYQSKQCLVSP